MSAGRPRSSALAQGWPGRLLAYGGVIALGCLAAALPLAGPSNQVISLATSTVIFAVAGSGLGFLWGQSGQLSMAHAAVFGLGGYAAAIGAKSLGLGFLAALPLTMLVGLVSGALVALPSLRTQGHYFVILTFAIGEVVIVVLKRLDNLTGGLGGIATQPGRQTLAGLRLANRGEYYTLCVAVGTLVLLVLLAVMRSRWGTTLRGIRENPNLAASLGVRVTTHRILAFALSGIVGAIGGQLYLYQVRFIEPNLFSANTSIIFLMIVLLGGKGYLLGPSLGALVYFFLTESLGLPPVYNQIAFGLILIVMILVAPGGLIDLGTKLATRRAGARRAADAAAAPASGGA